MAKKKKTLDYTEHLCACIVEGMQENKARDIVVLDLRALSSAVCDFFVICHGDSSTQVDGITNAVTRFTRKQMKEKPWRTEGERNSEWVLLDYIDVVAHIFYKEARQFYEIEELWADGIRTDYPTIN
ncbi:MAG: ribosome silencing factor [Flavobacteriales bacterium]|jgi:ribosome-associated protein